MALVQPDLKRLVAFSSVSHMGFVTLGLFVFTEQGVQGAILQMINHGLITGGLFLLVGVIYERTHDRTIAKMGGLAARMPVWAAVFGFFVFASGGLPGLSGFVGEFLVLLGTFEVSPTAAAIAAFVMVLAAGYLLYMYGRVVFGEVSDFLVGLGHHLTDMTPDRDPDARAAGDAHRDLRPAAGPLADARAGDRHRHPGRGGKWRSRFRSATEVVLIAGAIVVLAVAARIVIALRPGRSAAPGTGSGTVATEAGAAQ